MGVTLSKFSMIIVLLYFALIIFLLKKKKFSFKYSLLWLICGLVMFIIVAFPRILFFLAECFGIEVASNGLFAAMILLIVVILIFLTSIISAFVDKQKSLIQAVAILEKRIRECENQLEERGK